MVQSYPLEWLSAVNCLIVLALLCVISCCLLPERVRDTLPILHFPCHITIFLFSLFFLAPITMITRPAPKVYRYVLF